MPTAGTSQKMATAARTTLMTMRDGRTRKRRLRGVVTAGSDAACTALIL